MHSQLVSAYLGSDVELECRVEASPRPETVWLTGTGQRLEELLETAETTAVGGGNSSNFEQGQQLSNADKSSSGHQGANNRPTGSSSNLLLPSSKRKKYQFDEESDGYRTVMRLTLRRLESVDFGSYKCVAKNGLGEKEGLVRLYGKGTNNKRGVQNLTLTLIIFRNTGAHFAADDHNFNDEHGATAASASKDTKKRQRWVQGQDALDDLGRCSG